MFISNDAKICPKMSVNEDYAGCREDDCPLWIFSTMFQDDRDPDEIREGEPGYMFSHSHITYPCSEDREHVLNLYQSDKNDSNRIDYVDLEYGGYCGLLGKRGMSVAVADVLEVIKDPLNKEGREW